MLYPAQIRAARALLRMSQDELARRSGVGAATIKRIERDDMPSGTARTLERIERTLLDAGVVFLEDNGKQGMGVRFEQTSLGF